MIPTRPVWSTSTLAKTVLLHQRQRASLKQASTRFRCTRARLGGRIAAQREDSTTSLGGRVNQSTRCQQGTRRHTKGLGNKSNVNQVRCRCRANALPQPTISAAHSQPAHGTHTSHKKSKAIDPLLYHHHHHPISTKKQKHTTRKQRDFWSRGVSAAEPTKIDVVRLANAFVRHLKPRAITIDRSCSIPFLVS